MRYLDWWYLERMKGWMDGSGEIEQGQEIPAIGPAEA